MVLYREYQVKVSTGISESVLGKGYLKYQKTIGSKTNW